MCFWFAFPWLGWAPFHECVGCLYVFFRKMSLQVLCLFFNWKGNGSRICTHTCTAALFTIANIRKQPKCPSVEEWVISCGMCITEYYLAMRSNKIPVCGNMDETWGHNSKWNKSDSEIQMLYDFTHMWNLKRPNLWTQRIEKWLLRSWRVGEMGEVLVKEYRLPVRK